MKLALSVTKTIKVKKDTISFNMSFEKPAESTTECMESISADINSLLDTVKSMGVKESAIYVSPISLVAISDYVQETKTTLTNKTVKTVKVPNGFMARAYVTIELPLTWADETHKFGNIYVLVDKYDTCVHNSYYFSLKEKEKYERELRKSLLELSYNQALDILAGNKDVLNGRMIEPKKLDYSNVSSGREYGASTMLRRTVCDSVDDVEEQDYVTADIIDKLATPANAPETELHDSLSAIWVLTNK